VAEQAIETVERAIAAFNSGDLETLLSTFGPDAEWVTTPDFPIEGPHRGREGLARLFRSWWEAWEGVELDLELSDAGGLTLGVGEFRGRARSSGEEVAVSRAWLFELRDGAISRVVSFHDEAEARVASRELG
jgi:ketosteroid isomerase-like protein